MGGWARGLLSGRRASRCSFRYNGGCRDADRGPRHRGSPEGHWQAWSIP